MLILRNTKRKKVVKERYRDEARVRLEVQEMYGVYPVFITCHIFLMVQAHSLSCNKEFQHEISLLS